MGLWLDMGCLFAGPRVAGCVGGGKGDLTMRVPVHGGGVASLDLSGNYYYDQDVLQQCV